MIDSLIHYVVAELFEEQNHLWGALGAKYMPSVMYKLGIIDIRDSQIEAQVPPVRDIALEEASL